jgi:DNA primase
MTCFERGTAQPAGWMLRTMARRLAAVGDLWAEMSDVRQSLRAPMEAARMTPTALDSHKLQM